MIGLLCFLEDSNRNVFSGRIIDLDQWRITMKQWGGDTLLLVDTTLDRVGLTYEHIDEECAYHRYESLDEAVPAWPAATFVWCEQSNQPPGPDYTTSIDLTGYTHPVDNVIYGVGPDAGGLRAAPPGGDWVHVTSANEAGGWALVIAGVVLHDRWVKLGG